MSHYSLVSNLDRYGYNTSMKRSHTLALFLLLFLLLPITACSPEITVPTPAAMTETPTQIYIITATLPATVTPFPTQTPIPPTATLSFAPIEGQTTSLVNVRQAPSAASVQVGEVAIFEKIEILGKDPTNKWWLIDFPASPTGQGWVTVQFVQVAVDTSQVPVVDAPIGGGNPVPTTEASETESVSVSTVAPTAAFVTASEDGDSFEFPARDEILSVETISYIEYRSDLSAPEGDHDDWVQFVFDGAFGTEKNVNVIMNCSGSGRLNLELLQNGVPLQSWTNMGCDRANQLLLSLYVGAPYTLHLYTTSENGSLSYINYSVSVQLSK